MNKLNKVLFLQQEHIVQSLDLEPSYTTNKILYLYGTPFNNKLNSFS